MLVPEGQANFHVYKPMRTIKINQEESAPAGSDRGIALVFQAMLLVLKGSHSDSCSSFPSSGTAVFLCPPGNGPTSRKTHLLHFYLLYYDVDGFFTF